MTVIYPEFRDFCEIAADILGTTPEQIAPRPVKKFWLGVSRLRVWSE